ncbi:MAG: hypothetical protein AAF462_08925 [Thermodesulfobacteriota bacterium]
MLSSILRYTGYLILVFGFFYMSWHFGRAYEKGNFDFHIADASAQVKDGASCEDAKRVYQEVLNELDSPSPKSDWNTKYMEFTKR